MHFQRIDGNHIHTFVAKVFADFRFESLYQSLQRLSAKVCKYFRPFESMGLLPPKSAKTFHESLQILSPLRKSAKTFLLKVFPDFRGESICRLSWKVFADFGGNNYTEFRYESPISISK